MILIIMTNRERRQHVTNTNCKLYKSVYTSKNHKVVNHNHFSGLYC